MYKWAQHSPCEVGPCEVGYDATLLFEGRPPPPNEVIEKAKPLFASAFGRRDVSTAAWAIAFAPSPGASDGRLSPWLSQSAARLEAREEDLPLCPSEVFFTCINTIGRPATHGFGRCSAQRTAVQQRPTWVQRCDST